MAFQSIKRVLPSVVQLHGLTKQVQAHQVIASAQLVLRGLWGEERSKYVTPCSFREGTLKLETTSAAALQQLRVDQIKFMNELNRQLSARIVLRLELRSKGF